MKKETKGKKEKRTWGKLIVNFLASGGLLLVLILGAALAIVISLLFSK